ncbi:MAG: Fmu (Sun) domain-containing protein [Ferruginibacter sp.]|nr:Fmu (Sun) domain-containing protein [Ferruginibacter sp.]
MSRFHSYISSASAIIDNYKGTKPFLYHLKAFFGAEKKYGSRDRKIIASLCYGYFRTGHTLTDSTTAEKIIAGIFLFENTNNEILALLRPEWNAAVTLNVREKLSILKLAPDAIFPFSDETGDGIDATHFALSFLQQPELYLRIRPGRIKQVHDKLNQAAVPFKNITEHCLQIANKTRLDDILTINREVVIQDRNSQQVLNFIERNPAYFSAKQKVTAWDCCAASGGKALLLQDIIKEKLQLTVSDIRENILLNLGKRFLQAGININKKFIADLTKEPVLASAELFSIILCDAPCTGSGTWSRTPEQLFYFNKNTIIEYAERQKKIVSNIIPHLQPGGLLFYITCSVFKKENEEVVEYIKEKFHLPVLQMEYLKGYDVRADSLFVAVFSNG